MTWDECEAEARKEFGDNTRLAFKRVLPHDRRFVIGRWTHSKPGVKVQFGVLGDGPTWDAALADAIKRRHDAVTAETEAP